ncbi:MAG TPA: FAD-dependent oxidoreductase, partial [Gammaproteobacteria bacterium]|nr:FAD-dependent oxidoreductase [Gammaproteobacteria bacterium]
MNTSETQCCIVGGGPAGMMLALILARAGIDVTVLEKHGDFLRDFRGDTAQPSTLQILQDLGLMERFRALPVEWVDTLSVGAANGVFPLGDYRRLKPFSELALVPQWDLLNLLAEEGGRCPNYRLLMRTEGRETIEENGRIVGVRASGPEGEMEIRADLVVGTDGRRSTMRRAAGFEPRELGAPMDVLWFRLSREASDPQTSGGFVGKGQLLVMLNRGSYWQAGYVIAKGGIDALRARPLEEFQQRLGVLAPFLGERAREIRSWDDVSLLVVQVDRIPRWHRPGLLLIGDAAHAMSPVGGVGVNVAIQDAVAAANILGPVLLAGRRPEETDLARVQKRREWPVRALQRVQIMIQNRLISRALAADSGALTIGRLPRLLLRSGFVR